MTFVPHTRMTMLGTLPGPEIFSMSLSLADPGQAGDYEGFLTKLLSPNDAVWTDLADDCQAFFLASRASTSAVLKTVKFAPIGPDGKYAGPSVERIIGGTTGQPGGGGTSPKYPNQIACAMTLHSASDLGRVKGRFYLPVPVVTLGSDGRFDETVRDEMETGLGVFIDNLNNQPGLDVLGIRVVVASQGRRNKDGSVRLAPGNHNVTQVSVGRTLDTIRRRRNKLTEYRGTPTSVSI